MEACLQEQCTEFLGRIPKDKRGLHDGPCCWADVPLERPSKGRESWAMGQRAPDQCNKTSTGLEHSAYLAYGFAPIGKVLEA